MNVLHIITIPHGDKVSVKYEERRDPNRAMYQYQTSADPRIRALERREIIKKWRTYSDLYMARFLESTFTGEERRDGFDRRSGSSTPERGRRVAQRRKS